MKKLIMVAMTALGIAVFAQEQESARPGARRGMGRGPRMAERSGRPNFGPRGGMLGGGMPGDPAVSAVMNPQVANKIGISKEVQEQIQKLDSDSRKEVGELQKKTRGIMEKQVGLMKEAKPDEAAVMAAIDELFELRKAIAKAQTKRVLAVKTLLTPEQLAAALDTIRKFRDERRAKANAPKVEVEKKAAAPQPAPAK